MATPTNKNIKQPAGTGARGSDMVTVKNVNTKGTVSGRAHLDMTPKERADIKARFAAFKAKQDAENSANRAKEKYINGRKQGFSAMCRPSLGVYQFKASKVPTRGGHTGDWICSLQSAITFHEAKYANQENEFRVFIEGAEVTHYIQGSLSWTIESTGGMNTARFILNNNQDIFIITPQNVCAGPYNRGGWRVLGSGSGTSVKVYESVLRKNFRTDEAAKWRIYKTKYEIVAPDSAEPQIDSYTGMWLYPLNPYSCIFNRNDVVRIFVRLPHVSSFKRPGFKQWYDVWMPAFTGFIKDYNWNDDPVEGLRVVNITCYDYRGLLDRMRIRTNVPPDKPRSPKPRQKKKSGAAAPGAGSSQSGTPNQNNQPSHLKGAYLMRAQRIGKEFQKRFAETYKRYSAHLRLLGQKKLINPYDFSNAAFFMAGTLDNLYALWFSKMFLMGTGSTKSKGCVGTAGTAADALARGRQVRPGSINNKCAQTALRTIDGVMGTRAIVMTRASAKLVNNFGVVYELTGIPTTVHKSVTKVSGKDTVTEAIEIKTEEAKDVGAARKLILKKGRRSSVVGVLERAQKLMATREAEITKAIRSIYIYQGFANNGASALAASASAIAAHNAGIAVLKKVDEDVAAILNKSTLLKLEFGKAKRVISVTAVDAAAIQRARKLYVDQIAAQTKLLKCYEAELKNPSSFKTLKCNPNQGKARKKNAIQLDIYAQQRALKPLRAALGAVEDKRGSAGIGRGAAVYKRLKFKFPSFERMAVLLASGAKLQPTFVSVGNWTADSNKVENASAKLTSEYKANFSSGRLNAAVWAADVRGDTAAQTQLINQILSQVAADRRKFEKILGPKHGNLLKATGLQRVKEVITAVRATTDAGKKEAARAKSLPEVITKYAHFEVKQAGIFADLVTTSKDQPHPLMGKSFEQAVEFLCTEQSKVGRGVIMGISSYNQSAGTTPLKQNNPATLPKGDTKLDQFNRVALFGVIGRPLTYQEVTAVGKGTVSDLAEDFSPFNVFFHMLRPAAGTSPATIVQQQTGQTGMNATSVNYETRRKLLDDICSILDYQFYVSGWGDLVFEMPNYNAFPGDFGSAFRDAYTLLKEWKTASIAEEAQEIPTAWVITGMEPEMSIQKATQQGVAEHEFRKIVIMAPILARRLGVRVQNVNLRIPGIGAPAGAAGNSKLRSTPKQAIAQLEAYGFFHIQRQLGRAHTVSASLPFRPYIIPNRPIWLIHRQRIGLVQNVTHTMNPPNGECVTDISLGYTRWLHRDGTFRFIAGGQRQPIDYTAFFTGIPSFTPKEGVRSGGKSKTGKAVGKAGTGANCEALMARARQASAFSTAVAGNFGPQFQTPSQPGGAEASPPAAWAVNPPASGFRSTQASGNKKTPPSGPDASAKMGSKGSDGDTITKYFISPWKYLDPRSGKFQSFGFLRKAARRYYNYNSKGSGRNRRDYLHNGWDLIHPVGTHQLTPVPVTRASAVMTVGPLPGATTYAYIKAGALTGQKKLFMVLKGGGPTRVGEFVKIYADQYVNYLAISKKHGKVRIVLGKSGGLILNIWGYYSNPKVGKGETLIQLRYVHCSDLAKIGGKTLGVTLKKAESRTAPLAKPGDTVSFVGKTGARQPHLHVSMWIAYESGKTDADRKLIALTEKANVQFLRSTLMARAKLWSFDGTDPKNKIKMNDKANKYWQTAAKARKFGKKRGQVTVKDVVAFYEKGRAYRQFIAGPWDKPNNRYSNVNPALFFTPEQLIGSGPSKRKQSLRTRYGAFASAAIAMSSSKSARIKLHRSMCAQFGKDAAVKAQIAKRQCDFVFKTLLTSGAWTKSKYNTQVTRCKWPQDRIIRLVKLKLIRKIGSTYKAINKEIDVIAKRQTTRRYLQTASSRKGSLGLAYVNLDRRR